MKALQKNQENEKMAPGSQPDYHAYLLRLWREGAQKPWRAELVSPHTGAKQHFATYVQLLVFLETLASPPQETAVDSEQSRRRAK
jgi:hypothetical protein